jgi:hypothetical protein
MTSTDRHLVEYDMKNVGEDDLQILKRERIEQASVPLAMAW